MDLKNILSELHRIEALVDGWRTREQISTIERDLALDKLKSLYEAVRFAEVAAQEPPMPLVPSEEPHEEPEAAETTLPGEPLPAEEPAVIDFDDLMPLEEPIPDPEQPDEEHLEELKVEPEPEPEPAPEPMATEPEAEAEPAPAPAPEELEPKEEPKAPVIQNSLFDMDEMPIHRRTSRRVLFSLYGENPDSRSPKHKAGEEITPLGAASREPIETAPTATEPPLTPLEEAIREASAAEEPSSSEPLTASAQHEPQPSNVEPEPSDEEPIFREEEVTTVPLVRPSEDAAAPVLGEVIHAEQQTLADTFAPRPTVASSLNGGGGSLKDHIALNDRYLLRKELFGDSESDFHAAIEELDRMPSLDDCMIYIAENYSWNANSEAAKLLVDLLVRKYGE